METSRRTFLQLTLVAALRIPPARSESPDSRRIAIIAAPTNLGLRPGKDGVVPGTWKMPTVLLQAGLASALGAVRTDAVSRIAYDERPQRDTRIRNGNSIRTFSLALAERVSKSLQAGEFPVVLGGDCSVLLGALVGARWAGGRGLIHVDGHSDFYHPGNYDTTTHLGSAAGMDLALATGRGEPLLTRWPRIGGPLVADADAMQVGEREADDPDYSKVYGDILSTAITRITVQQLHAIGVVGILDQLRARLVERQLQRVWVHVDLDVLDQSVLPAVDSPGSPGLSSAELSALLHGLLATQRVMGVDFTIYDPDLDPERRYPRPLVDCIVNGIAKRAPSS